MTKMPKTAKSDPIAKDASTTKAARSPKPKAQGIKKQPIKNDSARKVTFVLPKEAAAEAETVCLMGEFNGWSRDATPMKRRANGDFSVSLSLETGRAYRFRYLIDHCKFENDWKADRYESNPYGGEDSVVEI
jgi:1,4-alpha-glucan branching enzyme